MAIINAAKNLALAEPAPVLAEISLMKGMDGKQLVEACIFGALLANARPKLALRAAIP